MNWNHLYCFYEVARRHSLKKAAKSLGNASSTLSEQIKKLEESLDVRLFDRIGRELILTDEGEEVYSYAKDIFEKGKRLIDSVSHNDTAGYSVKVGVENHLETSSVYSFLEEYWSTYADFGVVETRRSKNLSQSLYFLEHSVVDWLISSTSLNDDRFTSVKIFDLEYNFYCSSDLLRDNLDPHSLIGDLPLAKFGTNENDAKNIKNLLLEEGIYIKEELNSDHPEFLIQLCRTGKVVLMAPSLKEEGLEGLSKITLQKKLSFPIYVLFKRRDEQLLFIRKLKELITLKNGNPLGSSHLVTQFLSANWKTHAERLN
ncbi:LysR family transcriptional regulator [Bacteriovorax sp. Seq25_V]|uniref:LysR family transcriptional regulator n=1 Tax=Bacteriovorax sp. Seq25_V TaxID=1201288 RepID=UPI00038A2A49|nr:LysR family transcriptional regulator [Bacteriovorax sp. Seq25_V]EQC46584.1 transcriptional regulator, LysR family [Bacteriovorax sp. Seq25_V]